MSDNLYIISYPVSAGKEFNMVLSLHIRICVMILNKSIFKIWKSPITIATLESRASST